MKFELKTLLQKHDLSRIEKHLEKYLLPCVAFDMELDENPLTVGASKLGGDPDLPLNFEWFENNGRPLEFLLQINLSEVSKFDKTGLLPSKGLLSFFYDFENQPWGFDPNDLSGYKVVFFPTIDNLSGSKIEKTEFKLDEFKLSFKSAVSLPFVSSLDFFELEKKLELSDKEREKYWDFFDEFSNNHSFYNAESQAHRILGHSQNVQGDMQTEAQLVMNGYYCGKPFENEDPERTKIEANAGDWILLLQLDSDDKGNFMWGDCGMLYFWIRKEDLRKLNFDNVWMTLQCY